MKKTLIAVVALVAAALLVPSSAQAAVHYFSTTKTVTGIGKASCPSGYRVTGGGAELPADASYSNSSSSYKITYSRPVSDVAWEARGAVLRGTYSSYSGWRYRSETYAAKVYAICVH